jgi:hypothetical protein
MIFFEVNICAENIKYPVKPVRKIAIKRLNIFYINATDRALPDFITNIYLQKINFSIDNDKL